MEFVIGSFLGILIGLGMLFGMNSCESRLDKLADENFKRMCNEIKIICKATGGTHYQCLKELRDKNCELK